MRVLRSSGYHHPGEPGQTFVVRDCDLKDTLESAAIQGVLPGLLVVHDIFEMEDADIVVATFRAQQRMAPELPREQDMSMLYHYDASMLAQVVPGGLLTATRPAPLSPEDIEYVFEQLAKHPNYQNQLVISPAKDGTLVRLKDGRVERVA